MLKKEFREILMPALSRLGSMVFFLIIAMIVVKSTLKINIYVLCLAYVIFWIANNYGISAFKYEYRDNAFEYLLSFPYSKWRIFANKLIPRTVILIFFIILYEILAFIYIVPLFKSQSSQVDSFAIFDPLFFPLWTAYFLFAGFAIGLFEWKSLRIIIGFIHLLFTVFISWGIKTLFDTLSVSCNPFYYLYGFSFAIGAIIVAAIIGAAFVSIYKKFDLKSMKFHRKKFVFRSLPPLLLLTAVSIVFIIIK